MKTRHRADSIPLSLPQNDYPYSLVVFFYEDTALVLDLSEVDLAQTGSLVQLARVPMLHYI